MEALNTALCNLKENKTPETDSIPSYYYNYYNTQRWISKRNLYFC